MTSSQIHRRTILTAPLVFVACGKGEEVYFGKPEPPNTQRVGSALDNEPGSLDPAKTTGGLEFYVIPALFEGLTVYHPHLPQPMPALATHYEVSRQYDQFTIYLQKPFAQGLSNLFDIRVFKYARIDSKWRPQ